MYQRYMLSFYNIYRLSLGAISKCTGLILLHVLIETFLDKEFFFPKGRGFIYQVCRSGGPSMAHQIPQKWAKHSFTVNN